MNVTQIEETVKKLASDVINSSVDKDQFIYELMAAYGHRKTTVSRIKSGERNLAKVAGEVRAKRHIYFKYSDSNKVFSDIDDMKKEPSVTREKIRFIIATDFSQFVAVDTRTHDTLDIEFSELGKHFDFFLPWAGMEKAVYQGDNPADVKAAEKMAKLFDLIKADNFSEKNKNDTAALHSLNVFLTRLLFCFFAEDTGIFRNNQFSSELESHTKADGSDVDSYLNRLFEVLDTSKENRPDLPDYLAKFEYVNGGLFADAIDSPKFSTKSRRMLIECGSELDWSDINPDIFGSMIQAVVHPDQRGGMGMHYTSVINIMKVIEPLFLDDLYAELENIAENIDLKLKPSRLRKLHDRIANVKIFDPACGSGNFLIIAFKELRKLEMEIIKQLQEFKKDESQDDFFDEVSLNSSFSRIKLSRFYGIELDHFAHEVAILSLWLAEHQMNVEFKTEFGDCAPTLPLHNGGKIISCNANRIPWEDVCDISPTDEIYILGNPPYLGFRNWNAEHKEDMDSVFSSVGNVKRLDYVACWLKHAADFIHRYKAKASFVTTNSICQGEQVSLIWPYIFSKEIKIFFAYKPFDWKNSAKDNAGVTCIIIGLCKASDYDKDCKLFDSQRVSRVKSIGPYLIPNSDIIVYQTSEHLLEDIPSMALGSSGIDGGHLMLSIEEKEQFESADPRSKKFIRPFMSGGDFLNNIKRYCLWINDEDVEEALSIRLIQMRINLCKLYRLEGGRDAKKAASVPHRFFYRKYKDEDLIIVPRTSSGRRDYLPCGFMQKGTIVSNQAFVIYGASLETFAFISSRLHSLWMSVTSGRMRQDYSYSVNLTYNTFPFSTLNDSSKNEIVELAIAILSIREEYSMRTLAQLYDPIKMPLNLLDAHQSLDNCIEKLMFGAVFDTDEERLTALFNKYSEIIESQNA